MKKLIVPTILVLLVCAFGACNSDDDQTTPPQTVEDPMEEDPVDEDPVDEVVERTDRFLSTIHNGIYTTDQFWYENDTITGFGIQYGTNVESWAVDSDVTGKVVKLSRFEGSQGGWTLTQLNISYNGEWIDEVHYYRENDEYEVYETYYYFTQNGNQSTITTTSGTSKVITYDDQKRRTKIEYEFGDYRVIEYEYENNNLMELRHSTGERTVYQYDNRHNPIYWHPNTNLFYVYPTIRLMLFGPTSRRLNHPDLGTNLNNYTTIVRTGQGSSNGETNYEYEYDEFDFPIRRSGAGVLNYEYLE